MDIRNTPHFGALSPFNMEGIKLEAYEKKIGALNGSYLNPVPSTQTEQIAYRVDSMPSPKPAFAGSLNFGVTYLFPYTVEGEYSFTRGHFHVDKNYDEYYFGLTGQGFLLCWDGKEEIYAEKVFPGSIHYINGKYAHRLINTDSKETMSVAACWNVLAGHDYETIDRSGFPVRCFEVDGKPVWK